MEEQAAFLHMTYEEQSVIIIKVMIRKLMLHFISWDILKVLNIGETMYSFGQLMSKGKLHINILYYYMHFV